MEVINAAQRRLFIVSFVAYQVKSIGKALTEAVQRGVQIDVLLEASTAHGGKVDHDSAGDAEAGTASPDCSHGRPTTRGL